MKNVATTTKPAAPTKSRKGGRPLSFDRDAALWQAMLLFWRHGYEGTSINALTAVLGVTPPSIYAAFGDKKQLFREAVQLYSGAGKRAAQIINDAPTARAAADGLLRAAAHRFTGTETPPGCLLASSAITGSAESADVQAELAAMRRGVEDHLRQRIDQAVTSDEMPSSADAGALAGLVMAVIQGMSTLARDGASREHLLAIGQSALAGWPTKP